MRRKGEDRNLPKKHEEVAADGAFNRRMLSRKKKPRREIQRGAKEKHPLCKQCGYDQTVARQPVVCFPLSAKTSQEKFYSPGAPPFALLLSCLSQDRFCSAYVRNPSVSTMTYLFISRKCCHCVGDLWGNVALDHSCAVKSATFRGERAGGGQLLGHVTLKKVREGVQSPRFLLASGL